MVVVRAERIGSRNRVEVFIVQVADVVWGRRMEDETMDVILNDLQSNLAGVVNLVCDEFTSRNAKFQAKSLAIDHGIGSVVVTFSALLIPNTSVNKASIPAWTATPKQTLNKLRPMT